MTAIKKTCLLLFVKYPKKGTVKLRLCRTLNEDLVLELYRCFVRDTLNMIEKIDLPCFVCFHPPNAQAEFIRWLGPSYQFLPQTGSNLGERMKLCFAEVFTKGFQSAILMGSDSPDLPEDYINRAVSLLQTKDVVIGPTSDGGYYLIGFQTTTFTPQVFDGISWSTSLVLEETLRKLQQISRSVGILPVWSDIDTYSDLQNLINRSNNTAFKSSNSMTFIQTHHICKEKDNEKR